MRIMNGLETPFQTRASAFGVAVFAAAAAGAFSVSAGKEGLAAAAAGGAAALMTLTGCLVATTPISAAARATLLHLALNPLALAEWHPAQLTALDAAWRVCEKLCWEQCGLALLFSSGPSQLTFAAVPSNIGGIVDQEPGSSGATSSRVDAASVSLDPSP
jgi:hypothetical protein